MRLVVIHMKRDGTWRNKPHALAVYEGRNCVHRFSVNAPIDRSDVEFARTYQPPTPEPEAA